MRTAFAAAALSGDMARSCYFTFCQMKALALPAGAEDVRSETRPRGGRQFIEIPIASPPCRFRWRFLHCYSTRARAHTRTSSTFKSPRGHFSVGSFSFAMARKREGRRGGERRGIRTAESRGSPSKVVYTQGGEGVALAEAPNRDTVHGAQSNESRSH